MNNLDESKNEYRYRLATIILSCILSIILTLIAVLFIWYYFGGGAEHPGAFLEKKEYEGIYMVLVSDKSEKLENRTAYYTAAYISRYYDEYISKYETTSEKDYFYHIEQLYLHNTSPSFENDNIIRTNKEIRVKDTKGNIYYITLTNMSYEEYKTKLGKLYTPDVDEKIYSLSTEHMSMDEFLKKRESEKLKEEAEQATNP